MRLQEYQHFKKNQHFHFQWDYDYWKKNTDSLLKFFKSYLLLSKSEAKHKRFYPSFISKDIFFKGTLYYTKNKTKKKIPEVLLNEAESESEQNVSFKQKEKKITFCFSFFFSLKSQYAMFQPANTCLS